MASRVRNARRAGRGWVALLSLLLAGTLAERAGAVLLSGVVTNSLTSAPVEGVAIAVKVGASVAASTVTAADGSYSADVPPNTYAVTFTEDSYTTQS